MSLNTTQRALSRAFRDVTASVVGVLDEYEVPPEAMADLGEALLEVYAVNLARGGQSRSR